MTIGPSVGSLSSSKVKSMIMGLTGAQLWALNTRRVVINPQRHLAKSPLNSASDSPGLTEELSLVNRSNTFLTGRSYVGMRSDGPVNSVSSFVDTANNLIIKSHRQTCGVRAIRSSVASQSNCRLVESVS
jgi:hypothetical protein